jgi:glycosyltransferase involved in cell wall biosynthesis
VIATGAMEDYRRPRHVEELMRHADELGVLDSFLTLGVVPYDDLIGLMVNSVALLNPSRAEGWSTSVEEAKSLGKRILMSDLPVHREQAPRDGLYVDPDDATGLADAMWLTWTTFDPVVEQQRSKRAGLDLPGRIRAFGKSYQDIVVEVAMIAASRRAASRRELTSPNDRRHD